MLWEFFFSLTVGMNAFLFFVLFWFCLTCFERVAPIFKVLAKMWNALSYNRTQESPPTYKNPLPQPGCKSSYHEFVTIIGAKGNKKEDALS